MTQIPAGWYPDPAQTHPARQRYWDGTGWTEHVHDPRPPSYPTYPEPYAQGQPLTQTRPQAYPQLSPQAYGQPYGQARQAPPRPQRPTTPDGQPLSGWWRRVLAQVLDGLIMSPLVIGIVAAFVATRWDQVRRWYDAYSAAVKSGATPPAPPQLFQPWSAEVFGMAAAYALVLAVYTLGFWRWKQATPGKLIAGVRIRRRDVPGPMPWPTMVARFLFVEALAFAAYVPWVGALFVLAGLLDYLWPLWDGKNQALHDKVARTNVVLAPPPDVSRPGEPSQAELSAAGLPRRW